jgi:hypothetical protein
MTEHRYTLHQSLAYPSPYGDPMVLDDPDEARYEDETVTRAEARAWIASSPEAGSARADMTVTGLGNDYVIWYVPVAASRVLVVRWMLRSEEG